MSTKENYPISKILTDIAQSHGITFRYFTQAHFIPEEQKEEYPLLADLSIHLTYSGGLGVEIERDGMKAFEGSHNGLSIAYFGREVKKISYLTKEHGLLHSLGRRIHVILNENGDGGIKIEDLKIREAISKLGEDSFGSNFNKNPTEKYGFRQRSGFDHLPGVREFLETML